MLRSATSHLVGENGDQAAEHDIADAHFEQNQGLSNRRVWRDVAIPECRQRDEAKIEIRHRVGVVEREFHTDHRKQTGKHGGQYQDDDPPSRKASTAIAGQRPDLVQMFVKRAGFAELT